MRVQRSKRLLFFSLLAFFILGMVMLAFPSPVFAYDIQPPTREQKDKFIQEARTSIRGFANAEVTREEEYHIAWEDNDGFCTEVEYTLFVQFVTQEPESTDGQVGFFIGEWYWSEGKWTKEGAVEGFFHSDKDKTLDEQYEETERWLELQVANGALKPGWPTFEGSGEEVPPGDDEGKDEGYLDEDYSDEDYYAEEDYEEDSYEDEDYEEEDYLGYECGCDDEGSKIPGPGSWWEWLTGTVVAGAVTAGIGLLSTLFGATPTVPPQADPTFTGDGPHDLPTAGFVTGLLTTAGEPLPEISDNVTEQTFRNIWDELGTVPGYIHKTFYSDLFDPENWEKDARGLEDIGKWGQKKTGEAWDYLKEATSDPERVSEDWHEAKMKAARTFFETIEGTGKAIADDPIGTLKGLLGVDLWENAMDPKKPLPERITNVILGTLNIYGILEGGSGLKNWLMGAGGKKAATGLADDAAKGLGKVPKVKGREAPFKNLDKAGKGKAKTLWANETNKAGSKVKAFKKAMRSGDIQERTKAILEIQKDPLAIHKLNTQDPRVIKSFNRQLKNLHKDASKYSRERIALEKGVDPKDVEFFNATNPKAPGVKVKSGMDKDLTPRWKDKDGIWRDYPDREAQKLYDEGFYEAAGSPEGTTPAQLGKDCRNVAVNQHSAEAFGMSPDDWDRMQLGKPTSSTETVARTMEYKANEAFARADDLADAGNIEAAMKERFLGQRETVKSFKNQIKTRARYLGETDPGKLAPFNEEIERVKKTVDEMDRMIQQGADPVRIDDFLRSKNTTAEDLTKQIADIYRKLTPQ